MTRNIPKIKDLPERERPRERLLNHGPEKLTDAELLAIILQSGGKQKTAVSVAQQLLNAYKNFRGLDRKTIPEICEMDNIGPAKACQIKATLEIGKRLRLEELSEEKKISTSEDIYEMLKLSVRDHYREKFIIILLTSRNEVILKKTLFEGSLTESMVASREVVKMGIAYSAASIIFVHNHPSGDPAPSAHDKQITRRLKLACNLVDIRVLDHVIIGKDGYFSFSDAGLL